MPTTKVIQFSEANRNTDGLREAVTMLRSGGLVAFPTETVYGIGADALNEGAVQKVFQAKGRPSNNPLIVHVASMEIAWHFIAEISEKGLDLAKHFWPGPMTLVVKKKAMVPDLVTAGLETVAIRIPNQPVTLELLKIFKGGIVGPSANMSGRPSPTTAAHVLQDLNGKIDIILDSGQTTIGMESTVIDVTVDPPVMLRLGGLTREDIEKHIGTTRRTNDQELLQRSPGTRHRHYAPKAQVILIPKNNREVFEQQLYNLKHGGRTAGSITYSEELNKIDVTTFHFILPSAIEGYAQNIFRAIRELDNLGVDSMIIESVEEHGLGAAVMDRLVKAAQQW